MNSNPNEYILIHEVYRNIPNTISSLTPKQTYAVCLTPTSSIRPHVRHGPFLAYYRPSMKKATGGETKPLVHVSGQYTMGLRSGTWRYFSRSGRLIGKISYEEGVKHGTFYWCYEGSQMEVRGHFMYGNRSGLWLWKPFRLSTDPVSKYKGGHYYIVHSSDRSPEGRSSDVFFRSETYDEQGRLHGTQIVNRVLRFVDSSGKRHSALLPRSTIEWNRNQWHGTAKIHRRNGSVLCQIQSRAGQIRSLQFYRRGFFAVIHDHPQPDKNQRLFASQRSRIRQRSRSSSPTTSRSPSPVAGKRKRNSRHSDRKRSRPSRPEKARKLLMVVDGPLRPKTYTRFATRGPRLGKSGSSTLLRLSVLDPSVKALKAVSDHAANCGHWFGNDFFNRVPIQSLCSELGLRLVKVGASKAPAAPTRFSRTRNGLRRVKPLARTKLPSHTSKLLPHRGGTPVWVGTRGRLVRFQQ